MPCRHCATICGCCRIFIGLISSNTPMKCCVVCMILGIRFVRYLCRVLVLTAVLTPECGSDIQSLFDSAALLRLTALYDDVSETATQHIRQHLTKSVDWSTGEDILICQAAIGTSATRSFSRSAERLICPAICGGCMAQVKSVCCRIRLFGVGHMWWDCLRIIAVRMHIREVFTCCVYGFSAFFVLSRSCKSCGSVRGRFVCKDCTDYR